MDKETTDKNLDIFMSLLSSACEKVSSNTLFSAPSFERDLQQGTSAPRESSLVSVLHTGDTDSSDDEDKRNNDNTYNSFGKEIKSLLVANKNSVGERTSSNSSWTRTARKANPLSNNKPNQDTNKTTSKSDGYLDHMFGLRIKTPLISSTAMKERMMGREAISIGRVSNFVNTGDVSKDWVIAGVVVSKSGMKKSQKGNEYSIWTISDLRDDLKTVAVFLFKNAHSMLWKTLKGTVIAILNPSVMEKRNNCKDEATLSLDNPERLMILGQSKDLGYCKSIKKSTGEPCGSFVNVSRCEFCVYHVKQEYQKFSRRSELQSACNGRGLTALRNKVLGKNEVFYAGKSFMAIPASKSKKLSEKDNRTLQSLSSSKRSSPLTTIKAPVRKHSAVVELTKKQRAKDIERLKILGGTVSNLSTEKTPINPIISSKVCIEDAKANATNVITQLKAKNCEKPTNLGHKTELLEKPIPVIDKSNYEQAPICFNNLQLEIKHRDYANVLQAKREAGSKLVSKTSLKTTLCPKNNEKSRPAKMVPKTVESKESTLPKSAVFDRYALATSNLKKSNEILTPSQILINLNEGSKINQIGKTVEQQKSPPTPNNSFIVLPSFREESPSVAKPSTPCSRRQITSARLAALNYVSKNGPIKKIDPMNLKGIGLKKRVLEDIVTPDSKRQKSEESNAKSERYKRIMEEQSINADLIDKCDADAEQMYFEKQVQKEMMEEKMMTTFKIECKAVSCLKCKYTSFSASELCKAERHPLKVLDALKRFFKCADCSNRTVTLERIPTRPCTKCGSGRWEKTTMMREKIATATEVLSIRGAEEKFIGSVVTGANINLMVPE